MKSSALITSIAAIVIVGAAGVYLLFAKNGTMGAVPATTSGTDATEELITTPSDTAPSSGAQSSEYKDGTYTASASYRTPETTEPITVTLTLENGVVTDVSFTSNPQAPETRQYQAQFAAGYKQYVVGKNIDDIQISRVSGSSLTSGGFKAALEEIKAQAKA